MRTIIHTAMKDKSAWVEILTNDHNFRRYSCLAWSRIELDRSRSATPDSKESIQQKNNLLHSELAVEGRLIGLAELAVISHWPDGRL